MASLVGAGYRSWQGYEQGTSTPGGLVFEALVKLGFNATWFFADDVPMLIKDQVIIGDGPSCTIAEPSAPYNADFGHIPRYEVEASAGGGAVIHGEQVVDYLSFRAEWVRNSLGVSVRDLALISVIGDSMEPTLSEGDVVLLDMTTKGVMDGSIYALQLNGGLLVKRIQRKLDGSIVVKPDNPRYDTEIISEDSADLLKIIGRVVWVGRRL
jgi:phage repressor protein C with HTH and peptisase S24 domain